MSLLRCSQKSIAHLICESHIPPGVSRSVRFSLVFHSTTIAPGAGPTVVNTILEVLPYSEYGSGRLEQSENQITGHKVTSPLLVLCLRNESFLTASSTCMMPKRRIFVVFDESDTSTGSDVKRQKKLTVGLNVSY